MKYYPHTAVDVEEMLKVIGVDSLDELFRDVPADKRIDSLSLPGSKSEIELSGILNRLSLRNSDFINRPCFLGAGAYRHFSPSAVDAVLSRSEFYTAYTPYQAEASQGILQSIFEFQTLISILTGMDAANASLYDGSTACAEAVTLAVNQTRKNEVLYSEGLHPEYIEVLKTYFRNTEEIVLKEIPLKDGVTDVEFIKNECGKNTAGVLIQNPNCLGFIEDAVKIGEEIKGASKKALYMIAVSEPFSLGLIKNPGDCGADVCIGEAAGLGIPPSFGGPFVGFMATKSKYLRKIPGRLVGQTVDEEGRRAFCLTLQAREQHIRREKAASNICTNQALCALAVTVYLSAVGKTGFAKLSRLNMEKAHYLKERLLEIPGFKMYAERPFFNEFTLECPDDPVKISTFLRERGVTGGFITGRWKDKWKNLMTFCVTELNTRKDIDDLASHLSLWCREGVSAACTIN